MTFHGIFLSLSQVSLPEFKAKLSDFIVWCKVYETKELNRIGYNHSLAGEFALIIDLARDILDVLNEQDINTPDSHEQLERETLQPFTHGITRNAYHRNAFTIKRDFTRFLQKTLV